MTAKNETEIGPRDQGMPGSNGPGGQIKTQGSVSQEEPPHFSFGQPRSGRTAPRRLFARQKELMPQVFTTQAERSRAILRVVSG